MGCDIHIVLERQNDAGKWVGVQQLGHVDEKTMNFNWWSQSDKPADPSYVCYKIRERDYQFFWALAGVRGGWGEPGVARGLPEDMSDLSSMVLVEHWGDDLHSMSWLTIPELIPILARCKYDENAVVSNDDGVDLTAAKVANTLTNTISDETIVSEWIGDMEREHWPRHRIVFGFDN